MASSKKLVSKKKVPVKKPADGAQYFSRAVSKALETLELLQLRQVPMTLSEIARQVQLSKTSVFRLLRTLETLGYVATSGWGKYALAPGVHSLVSTRWLARLLRTAALPLQGLTRDLHETASMAALFDNRIEVIAVVESPQAVRMSNVVGHIVPPNSSSLGKAITAFQTEERREKLLRSNGIYRFTDHTIVDRAELFREWERVRAQKFATDREESVYDGVCFGVPIFGESGEVNAAISVSLPKARLRQGDHPAVIMEALAAAAAQVATDLRSVTQPKRATS
ncbi:MAG: IclR family transcriptional regulator [Bryobacteraceae bacterium]|jgi:IclR family acetate operon transcriptional repressor